MTRIIFLFFASIFLFSTIRAQTGYIVLKKKNKSLQYFWKDNYITFQTRDGTWNHGIITKINNDSFALTQEIIRYGLGTDTVHFSGYHYSLDDIYALPTKKEQVVFENDRVYVVYGHEKFIWVRNGFVFQVVGAGILGLNIINDLARNDPPFAKNKLERLGYGAGSFILGTILHFTFYPHIRIGRKYHLEAVTINHWLTTRNLVNTVAPECQLAEMIK